MKSWHGGFFYDWNGTLSELAEKRHRRSGFTVGIVCHWKRCRSHSRSLLSGSCFWNRRSAWRNWCWHQSYEHLYRSQSNSGSGELCKRSIFRTERCNFLWQPNQVHRLCKGCCGSSCCKWGKGSHLHRTETNSDAVFCSSCTALQCWYHGNCQPQPGKVQRLQGIRQRWLSDDHWCCGCCSCKNQCTGHFQRCQAHAVWWSTCCRHDFLHRRWCHWGLFPKCSGTGHQYRPMCKKRSEDCLHSAERHGKQAGSHHSEPHRHSGSDRC